MAFSLNTMVARAISPISSPRSVPWTFTERSPSASFRITPVMRPMGPPIEPPISQDTIRPIITALEVATKMMMKVWSTVLTLVAARCFISASSSAAKSAMIWRNASKYCLPRASPTRSAISFMVLDLPTSRRNWICISVTFVCQSRRIFSASPSRATWPGLSLTVACSFAISA